MVIDNREVSRVGNGFLLLGGIHKDDTPEAADFLCVCLGAQAEQFIRNFEERILEQ
ncbi:MAG: hypothetical protein HQL09_06490 [Nitrospirae bacterium]|nr:hypothetical protein [Nitrospirota bacterium]